MTPAGIVAGASLAVMAWAALATWLWRRNSSALAAVRAELATVRRQALADLASYEAALVADDKARQALAELQARRDAERAELELEQGAIHDKADQARKEISVSSGSDLADRFGAAFHRKR